MWEMYQTKFNMISFISGLHITYILFLKKKTFWSFKTPTMVNGWDFCHNSPNSNKFCMLTSNGGCPSILLTTKVVIFVMRAYLGSLMRFKAPYSGSWFCFTLSFVSWALGVNKELTTNHGPCLESPKIPYVFRNLWTT